MDKVGLETQGLSIQNVRGEVNPGEKGSAVRTVYEYLRQYGYFPNPRLEQAYPYWAPLVPDAPGDPRVYSPELEEGVSRYQAFMGLPKTGRVDSETLHFMQQPRCGHPENEFANRDLSEQWASLPNFTKWSQTTITYEVTSSGFPPQGGLDMSTIGTALDAALLAWRNVTYLNLRSIMSGTPDTEVKFWPQGSPPSSANWLVGGTPFDFSVGGVCDGIGCAPDKHRIGLNSGNWGSPPMPATWAGTPTPGKYDISSVLQHEIGHTLGFAHSSAPQFPGATTRAVMFPSTPLGLGLTIQPDDRQAASALYQLWQVKSGYALDIAAGGPANVRPKVYAASSSNSLWFWTYNNTAPDFGVWAPVAANAIAVAVDDAGVPWAVSSDNSIWQGNGNDPLASGFNWGSGPKGPAGTARDVAASGNQVWIISNNPASGSPGDFVVKQWGGGTTWVSTNGVGVKIAVDWAGRPWVVQANGAVWRFYTSTNTTEDINTACKPIGSGCSATLECCSTSCLNSQCQGNDGLVWKQLTQLLDPNIHQAACAHDIGAGADHSVWIIGCTAAGSNFDIWIWDEQPVADGAVAQGQFIPTDGYASRITASPDGRPWVSQAAGTVYRRSPTSLTP